MTETPREHEETNITNPVGKVENFVSKHFVRLLVWLAVSGGALAIFGPGYSMLQAGLVKPTRIFAFISFMSPVALLLFWGSWKLTAKTQQTE